MSRSCKAFEINMLPSLSLLKTTDTSEPEQKGLFYKSTLKQLIEIEKRCIQDPASCDNADLWKRIFESATTYKSDPGRPFNLWAWYFDNFAGPGSSEAFLKSVYWEEAKIKASYSAYPNVIEMNKKLSDHFRRSVHLVMFHRLLFGGEFLDITKPFGGDNVLESLNGLFFAQVSTFLSRKNGSIPALVRFVKAWKKKLPTLPSFDYKNEIKSSMVEAIFREAVRLSYDPRWNSHMDGVDKAAKAIVDEWNRP